MLTSYPETDYYQISGYRAHSNGWFKMYDDKPLIEAIITSNLKIFRPDGQDSPVELVLGILPSGASYLLMTSEQMQQFTTKHHISPPKGPWSASNFLSLSPIYFHSSSELTAKFATYKQRPRNKNRREREKPDDNSQANRGYVKTDPNVVHYRGYFEHQRTLYGLLTRNLEPTKVGLVPPSWLSCVRVLSLVFEEWSVDNRRRGDRLKDPNLINVGWTDAFFPSFFEQLTGSTIHFKLEGNLKNTSSRDPSFSEVVKGDHAKLCACLRDLFDHDANKSGVPVMVLVHDEEMARSVLSRAGINVDSCPSGLSHLLPLPAIKSRHKVENTKHVILPGPSFVDTQKLVNALMETMPKHTVPLNAEILHMQTDTKTCAGDDSLLQLRMWLSMAQGPAIDEQRKERLSHEPGCAQVLAPPAVQRTSVEVNPNGVDPNDADPNDMPPGRKPTIEDDFSDDDDW